MKLRHVEIWSNLECASGTHVATIPTHDILGAQLEEDLDGRHDVTLVLSRESSAWASISNQRVMRVVYTDGSVTEHRIIKPQDTRTLRGEMRGTVKARGVLLDLQNGMVSRSEANGTVTLFYTLLSLTRDELVTLILAAAPAYFTKGTIDDSSEVVEAFTFNFDTPLRALQELADMEGVELAVRRNGATDYLVDLLTQVGSTAAQPEFRYRKNLKGIERTLDSTVFANRIYPAGGGDDAVRLTIGEAQWTINAVGTYTLDLDGEPLYEDDQLNGMYIETPGGSFIQITDSDATLQRITTASAHGLSASDKIKFRADAAGLQLPYVESPSSQATYGLAVGVIEETDLSPVINLAPNAAFRAWTGSVPDEWSAVNAPTLSQETSALYTKVGGSAAKVIATVAGQGIQSDAVTIAPSDPNVYYSAFVDLYVTAGAVEFYLEHSTEGRFPLAGADEQAFTSEHDKFVRLEIAGKQFGSGTLRLVVVARSGAATFYVDAAQLVNYASNVDFFEGNAATLLWQRATTALDEQAVPVTSYKVDVMDLTAVDPSSWPYDAITLGGTVLVEDEVMSLQVQTRALSIVRDLLTAATVRVELSNKAPDLVDILSRRKRRVRQTVPPRASIALINKVEVTIDGDGTVYMRVWGGGAARSFRYIADINVMPTIDEVVDTGGDGTTSNYVDGTEVAVAGFRDTSQTRLQPNQRAFIRVVAYPILNAGGVPGASVAAASNVSTFWLTEILDSAVVQGGDAGAGTATVTRSWEVDERCSALRVYRKKGGWPTKDGTQAGALDPTYDRGTVGPSDLWKYVDGGYSTSDVVYDIAVAYDVNGFAGEREEYSYTLTGATTNPQMTGAYRTNIQDGTSCLDQRTVRVTWSLTDCTDGANAIKVWRKVYGTEDLIKTEQSPVTNSYYEDDGPGMADGGTETSNLQYRIELWDTALSTMYDSVTLNEDDPRSIWAICPV